MSKGALTFLFVPLLLAAGRQDAAQRRWELEVSHGKLRPISVRSGPARDQYRTFWYLTLHVTNRTGADRPLDLMARALTPQDRSNPVCLAGFYPEVTEKIAAREGRPLVNLLAAPKVLQDGRSVDLVIVFPKLSKAANEIDVRIEGLASRIFRAGRASWLERREYSIRFRRLGDEYLNTLHRIEDLGAGWVLVERRKIRG